jgi:hypothetical protein
MSGRVWLAVLGAYLAGHALNALKWRMLVNAGRPELSRLEAVRFHYAGLFANMWLPGMVGGDVLRAVMASRARARPEAVVLGAWPTPDDTCSRALLRHRGFCAGILPRRRARHNYRSIPAPWLVQWRSRWPCADRSAAGPAGRGARGPHWSPSPAGVVLAAKRAGALALIQGAVPLNAWIGHDLGITAPLGVADRWSLAAVAVLPISLGGLRAGRHAGGAARALGVTVALGVGLADLATVLIVRAAGRWSGWCSAGCRAPRRPAVPSPHRPQMPEPRASSTNDRGPAAVVVLGAGPCGAGRRISCAAGRARHPARAAGRGRRQRRQLRAGRAAARLRQPPPAPRLRPRGAG